MRVAVLVLCVAVALAGCRPVEPLKPPPELGSSARSVTAPPPPGVPGDPPDRIYASSLVFASCLLAYDALKSYWLQHGVELTPREFSTRHGRVACVTNESGMIEVTFSPVALQAGGGISYVVDPHSMQVIDTIYGR